MRVVVTGAAGFIGSTLCDALLAAGHDVVGIDGFTDYYDRAHKEANLAGARHHPSFSFHELDLRTDALEGVLDGADVVVNEAATPGLVLSWEDFAQYESCNVYAVHRLIKACQRVGTPRIVHASTSSVYGPQAVGSEDRIKRPISPYGVTKLAAEHLLLAHHDMFGLPVVVLRYFSIYGPRQRPDMAFRIICERLLDQQPITIYGDGLQSRGNTHVDDCVDATIRAMTMAAPGTVLNVGGAQEINLLRAVEVLAAELGVEPVLVHEPARPGDQRRTIADISAAAEVLGWVPRILPEQGLADQARWARDRRS